MALEFGQADPKRDLVKFLQRLVVAKEPGHSSVIQCAAARIVSALLSDFPTNEAHAEDAMIMVKHLIQISLKSSAALSDYIIAVCLAQLLLIPNLPNYFLSLDGMMILRDIVDRNSKDLQVTYYAFLALWELSFEEPFKKHATDPRVR